MGWAYPLDEKEVGYIGSGTKDVFLGAVQICRNGIRKAKVHLKLDLARDAKNNTMGF